jgi:hypothetical protein
MSFETEDDLLRLLMAAEHLSNRLKATSPDLAPVHDQLLDVIVTLEEATAEVPSEDDADDWYARKQDERAEERA